MADPPCPVGEDGFEREDASVDRFPTDIFEMSGESDDEFGVGETG